MGSLGVVRFAPDHQRAAGGRAEDPVHPVGRQAGNKRFQTPRLRRSMSAGGKAPWHFFKLYALDTALDLKPGATRKDVELAMGKHILAQGQLMGTYKRK